MTSDWRGEARGATPLWAPRGRSPRPFAVLRRRCSIPFQCAFLPFIRKADGQHREENQHRPKAGCAELSVRDRPREQEGYLEVENDEKDRDQIEADVELHAGVVEGVKSALT